MRITFCVLCCLAGVFAIGQNAAPAASKFISTLDSAQRLRALYPFDIDERYNFHFFPKDDRKGIMLNDLTPVQKAAAFDLVKTCLSDDAVKKVKEIMGLDNVLKAMEHRPPNDHFRDSGKYYFTIFGIPGDSTTWGWRLEGHHISFNFSANKGQVVSGTPGFLGANPAIVREGPQKGEQVFKDEADMGFGLLHSLSESQLTTARVDTTAPNEIITFVSRKAMLLHPEGIRYAQMTAPQQQQLLQLVRLYVNRYTRLFADKMLKEIEKAGLDNLSFAWAGSTEESAGKPHYYRIQGPTIIIEYDNSQNNANHVHSVVRDLQNDFGGDMLLQHYREDHGAK
ncbi:MAG TPA: DUF3500 domain-containing protein [Chitinophagaceae bacterium]|nr:DUF3500 domain-containing protein [Chitinophagaceae bacterium]